MRRADGELKVCTLMIENWYLYEQTQHDAPEKFAV